MCANVHKFMILLCYLLKQLQTDQPEQSSNVEANAVDSIITTSDDKVEMNQLTENSTMELPGSHSLQVTDEEGNPLHFTLQDGRQLQVLYLCVFNQNYLFL